MWWLLGAYLVVGFWFGWMMLGMGLKHRHTVWEGIRGRIKTLRHAENWGLLLGITVGWLPAILYIVVMNVVMNRRAV